MQLSDFDYELPKALIAQKPAEPRESARLLHLGPEDQPGANPADRYVADLPGLLRPDDVLVVNDTKVIPSRIDGRRGDASIELTLHKQEAPAAWYAFARNAKRLKVGDWINLAEGLRAAIAAKDGGEVLVQFDTDDAGLMGWLDRNGRMPLPPYIKRPDGADPADRQDYQTIFADTPGAVAAPTASLHFTPTLIEQVTARGITIEHVTLHVGAGTFLPVTVEDVDAHIMHAEMAILEPKTAARLQAARDAGRRIVAVGTTVVRTLETAARSGRLEPYAGETRLFIKPGFRFHAVDAMLTNFHLPKSTLMMLVAAFAGYDRILEAYRHAVRAEYRFFSYGDACFLEPAEA